MADKDKAAQRLEALGNQLGSSGLPSIKKVAPGSSTLRVEGKVIIITGMAMRYIKTSLVLTEMLTLQRRQLASGHWPSHRAPVCRVRRKGHLHLRLRCDAPRIAQEGNQRGLPVRRGAYPAV